VGVASRLQASGTGGEQRFDFLWLLRQAPSIMELSYLDSSDREQLRVSRLSRDGIRSRRDYWGEPTFREAMAA
jgi:two-component system NtrC family sensor kinase